MKLDGIGDDLLAGRESVWFNPRLKRVCEGFTGPGAEAVADAAARLRRFAPVIRYYFPETEAAGGIIESPLVDIPKMKSALEAAGGCSLGGRLMLKMDSHLPISGSVKARGGIYEVLKHTETLALESGILSGVDDDYLKLVTPKARELFSRHKIEAGSTGNLGLSIGIMSAALGYEAIIHMSADAKQWKRTLLRKRGATVREYEGSYSEAVACGRRESDNDASSYFVDDERSADLFLGYAVAGERLRGQLDAAGVIVDESHPLYVYVPCGVGGAPGGIIYGLKLIYGDAVHCFIVEPVQAPCMLLGLQSGLYENISVEDAGLSGNTVADGLAVGRPSGFVSRIFSQILDGGVTVDDSRLNGYLKMLYDSEGILIEPSACAGFRAPEVLAGSTSEATHIVWATGGNMVPQSIWDELLK